MEEARPASDGIAATVFRDLRAAILGGRLQPGERLPGERELAQKYATNRNTLREAVRKLEQARLVTVRHGQGVTVADFRRNGTMELLPPYLETGPSPAEVLHLLGDLLPARLLVIDFLARLAVRRAERGDIERIHDITDLLVTAFERRDAGVIARGFHRWLDALIDATHSMGARWIANPFLEAYREMLDRFPQLWVLDDAFPNHLREVLAGLEARDEARVSGAIQGYYARVDAAFASAVEAALGSSPGEREPPAPPRPHEPTPKGRRKR